ncbi:MAG: shikimate kinase [bacterium]
MRGPIALIGMMGSGKTSIGRALSQILSLPWVDLDRELEKRHHQRVSRQFQVSGEAVFRRREAALLRALCRRGPVVLSTGGGVVLRADNRLLLRRFGAVYLAVSPRVLAQRLEHESAQRPLLQGGEGNLESKLSRLLRQRGHLYRTCARWTVRASQGGPEAVAQRIKVRLQAGA